MSDAPERIFIKRTHPHKDDLDWYVWSDGTEYIRADVSAARIAGLEEALHDAICENVATIKRLAELERQLAEAREVLLSLPAVYARQINTGVREVYDPLQRFYRMEDVLHALNPKGTADDRA